MLKNQTDTPELKNYKLDRILKAAELCKNPQFRRKTILVAGTNAKGSIVSYLSALFEASKKKVGSYYSPHIEAKEERIQINRQKIAPEEWARIESEFPEAFKDLSFFENATLTAWIYFRSQKVDVQVLEVGMGGRLDATNISDPDISVIGPIGWDHAEILGDSLEQIAIEKSGIMRRGRTTWVEGNQADEVFSVFVNEADDREVNLFTSAGAESDLERKLCEGLKEKGEHQVRNALLAYRVYLAACEEWNWNQVPLSKIIEVLRSASLSGRTQIYSEKPLWILDGGHNEQAVQALIHFLNEHSQLHGTNVKFEMVFGLMKDKNLQNILKILQPFAGKIHLASFYPEREVPPEEIQKACHSLNIPSETHSNLSKMLKELKSKDSPVLVCGSFYLVGEVLCEMKSWNP